MERKDIIKEKIEEYLEKRTKDREIYYKSEYKSKLRFLESELFDVTSALNLINIEVNELRRKEHKDNLAQSMNQSKSTLNFSNLLKPVQDSIYKNSNKQIEKKTEYKQNTQISIKNRSKTPFKKHEFETTTKELFKVESSSSFKTRLDSQPKLKIFAKSQNFNDDKHQNSPKSFKEPLWKVITRSPLHQALKYDKNSEKNENSTSVAKNKNKSPIPKKEVKKIDTHTNRSPFSHNKIKNKQDLSTSQFLRDTESSKNKNVKKSSVPPEDRNRVELVKYKSSKNNENNKNKNEEKRKNSLCDSRLKTNEMNTNHSTKVDQNTSGIPNININKKISERLSQEENAKQLMRRVSNAKKIQEEEKKLNEPGGEKSGRKSIQDQSPEKSAKKNSLQISPVKLFKKESLKAEYNSLRKESVKSKRKSCFKKLDVFKQIENKSIQSIILSINNGFLMIDPRTTWNILTYNQTIYSFFKSNLQESLSLITLKYQRRLEYLNKYLNNSNVETLLSKPYVPSKTSINGIKFFKKEDEELLLKSEQPEEVLNVFRIILIIQNIDYTTIPQNNKLIEYVYNEIFKEQQVDSMKAFFNDRLLKQINLSVAQITKIIEMVKNHPKVIFPAELMKFNKILSYMCFVLKDIYDFNTVKFENEYLFNIREFKNEAIELNKKLDFLKENAQKN